MSSISSSENPYAYYSKRLEELEDEYRKNTQRGEESRDREIERLREKHVESLDEIAKKSEESVDRLRHNMQEDVADIRRASEDERSRLKEQTYNQLGKFNGLEADVLKEQLADTTRAFEEHRTKSAENLEALNRSHERTLDELAKQTEHRLIAAAEDRRNGTTRDYETIREEQLLLNKDLRDKLEGQTNELNRRTVDDMRFGNQIRDNQLAEERRAFEHALNQSEQHASGRLDEVQRLHDRKMYENTARERISHADQIAEYQAQLKAVYGSGKDASQARAQGKAEALQELEGDHRNAIKNVTSSYERQLVGAKLDQAEQDDQFRQKLSDRIREKDQLFGKILSEQALENHQKYRALEENFIRDREALVAARQLDNQMASERVQLLESRAAQERASALEEQANAYRSTIENIRAQAKEQVQTLEQAIQTKATSSDTSDIPPAAEAKLRANFEAEMERKLNAEMKRNRDSEESIRNSYSERINEMTAESRSRETRLSQETAGQNQSTRKQMANEVQGAHEQMEQLQREFEDRHERSVAKIHNTYQREMARLQRDYEDILAETKADASLVVQNERQDNEFKLVSAQKENVARANSIIREYENKLSAQKEEFDATLDEFKLVASRSHSEMEKQNRLQVDSVRRNYEQRIAELESQHKERERNMEENFTEQLEKVKRANALQARTKS